jgi:phytoene dehydrogenase-like protein
MTRSHEAAEDRVDLAVIGGGLAGLTATALVAKAGRSVAVLEGAAHVGGHAVTHLRQGVHFNLEPHALYGHGHARRVLRELDVMFSGRSPDAGDRALPTEHDQFTLQRSVKTLVTTRLLSPLEKWRLAGLIAGLPRIETRSLDRVPASQRFAKVP